MTPAQLLNDVAKQRDQEVRRGLSSAARSYEVGHDRNACRRCRLGNRVRRLGGAWPLPVRTWLSGLGRRACLECAAT